VADHLLTSGLLEEFEPAAVALTAWAFAELGIRYTSLMDRLASRTLELQETTTFTEQQLSMIVWAMEQAWDPR
jgi:hypothetical protein